MLNWNSDENPFYRNLSEGTDLKNDKNHSGIDDKDEKEPKDNIVKKTEKMAKEEVEAVDENLVDKAKAMRDKERGVNNDTQRQRDADARAKANNTKASSGNIRGQGTQGNRDRYKPNKEMGKVIRALNDPKTANINRLKAIKAKVDAKKTQKESTEEELDLFELLDAMHEEILDIEEELETAGYDLDEIFEDDEIEEGFEGSSKMKRLMAQRKAAMRRKLRQGAPNKK